MDEDRARALAVQLSATQGVLFALIRYLAEELQVHTEELCCDLDVLCSSHPDPLWQEAVMRLTEGLRSSDPYGPSKGG